MILLWGLCGDRPLKAVKNALEESGCPIFFLDQADALNTEVELVADSSIRGVIRQVGRVIELERVRAVYLRPYDSRRLPSVLNAGKGSPAWVHAINLEDILTSWIEMTPAFVVNLPSAMSSNSSKPYQSMLIKLAGFLVPETLVTTDPASVLEFWERHGTVVYKSTSGVRSIVSRLTQEHLKRIKDVRWCPSQFQEYIPGDDYRIHIIGDEVFSCKIVSTADDYRYAGQNGESTKVDVCSLPDAVAERCVALTRSLNLNVAGIDLRQTPSGEWFCFEVNPSPGYSYYQEITKQPIAQSIARCLAAV